MQGNNTVRIYERDLPKLVPKYVTPWWVKDIPKFYNLKQVKRFLSNLWED